MSLWECGRVWKAEDRILWNCWGAAVSGFNMRPMDRKPFSVGVLQCSGAAAPMPVPCAPRTMSLSRLESETEYSTSVHAAGRLESMC